MLVRAILKTTHTHTHASTHTHTHTRTHAYTHTHAHTHTHACTHTHTHTHAHTHTRTYCAIVRLFFQRQSTATCSNSKILSHPVRGTSYVLCSPRSAVMLTQHKMKLQEDYFGLLSAARSTLKFGTLFAQWIKSEHYWQVLSLGPCI